MLTGGAGADRLEGGTGRDMADYSGSGTGVTVNLQTGAASGGDATGDSFHGVDGLIGSAHDDTLTGFDQERFSGSDQYWNVIYGGGGNDQIDGRAGDDTLHGGVGDDVVEGGTGNDIVAGDAGDDLLFGGAGDDALWGGTGADHLDGGAGADRLDGGDGNDQFSGRDGDDQLFGGAGDDLAEGEDGSDSLVGGAGHDTLVGGAGNDALDGGTDDDRLWGGGDHDTLVGADGEDSLWGGEGFDLLFGGDGEDDLTGGLGANALFGGAGDDLIEVVQGDTASGGNGDDTFALADLGVPGPGSITVMGGEGEEASGDTLLLGDRADMGTLVFTSPNRESGHVTLDDGSTLYFSEIENVICFAAGTRIATPLGARPVETLRPGDLVVTRDHGLQPVRWAGRRSLPGLGRFAPVRLRAGALPGLERDLLVSPQHRMLLTGYHAELMFAEHEVLAAACHLMDGRGVTQDPVEAVTYVHVLFDAHEVIYAEGAATEAFHPGEIGLSAIEDAAREELFAIFPELRALPASYGPTARRCLKAHEARLMR